MTGKLNLSLCFAAGLLGGCLSHYISPPMVQAQTQAQAPKVVQAQSFVLVDATGSKVGEFAIDTDGRPNIKLFDDHGLNGPQVIWNARGPLLKQLLAGH